MSKHQRRVQFVVDGPSSSLASYSAREGGRIEAHQALDFSTGPDHSDLDERERRKLLAMMFAKRDAAARPWCESCSKHKVSRVGKGMDAPLDTLCNACGRAALEHGPKKAFEYHAAFCSTCGRRKIKKDLPK